MPTTATGRALDDALRVVRMAGVFYCPSELTEPWGISLPPMPDCVWFHAVTEGACTVDVDGDQRVTGAGDLLLVPHGTGHRAWGRDATDTPNVLDLPHDHQSDQYAVLRYGGGGDRTHIVCGGVRLEHPAARRLTQALPSVIHIEAAHMTRADWMQATIELIGEETRHVQPGGEAVVSRLCDIVVIQAIRQWIDHDPAAQTGWLGALQDDRIGRVIAAIHDRPDHDWTVASLAAHAGMSRSSLSARFTDLVGEPVMTYLTNWRMSVALDLLRSSDTSVAAAGRAVGYQSEAAFSRAFRRVHGTSARVARGLRDPVVDPV